MAERRRYTKREKATAVTAALASSVKAAAENLDVPRTTLTYWMEAPEFVTLRQKTREQIAEGSILLAQLAQDAIAAKVRAGEVEPRDLAVIYGIAIDKGQLLSGAATSRTETKSLTDGLNDHEKQTLRDVIDRATAEFAEADPEAIRSELGPRFANEQQRQFFDSQAPEVLYSGAFGAGKSRILCEKAYHLGLRYPGAPIGIFRKVRASLAATTAITFFRDVVPAGAIVKRNVTEGWYELSNGSRFWLLGLDVDTTTGVPSKVGSLDLAYAFVDEAVELDAPDWMMLEGRLRWPGVPYTQIGGATNPSSPKHWLIEHFREEGKDRLLLNASTTDNKMLPASYLERLSGFTGAYRELYVRGLWIDTSGGLFDPAWIRQGRPLMLHDGPNLQRIVVAVDPAVTANKSSDETGIIVAGIDPSGQGYVLADLSGRMAPHVWAERVVEAYNDYKADVVVAEVNNGGDLVTANLRNMSKSLPVKTVTASRGKIIRAEPVARLYGEGRVLHAGEFPELESQMIGYDGKGGSPDRLDALVWALTDLMLKDPWGAYRQAAAA